MDDPVWAMKNKKNNMNNIEQQWLYVPMSRNATFPQKGVELQNAAKQGFWYPFKGWP